MTSILYVNDQGKDREFTYFTRIHAVRSCFERDLTFFEGRYLSLSCFLRYFVFFALFFPVTPRQNVLRHFLRNRKLNSESGL